MLSVVGCYGVYCCYVVVGCVDDVDVAVVCGACNGMYWMVGWLVECMDGIG